MQRLTDRIVLMLEQTVKGRTEILQSELDELRAQIAALDRALEEKPDYGLGQGDPAVTDWELNRALLRRLKRRAASLEQALSQASQGTYGTCVQCGKPIHPDRLAVLPDTRLCIHCAQAGEHR
jgi:DnaK suppressor protein